MLLRDVRVGDVLAQIGSAVLDEPCEVLSVDRYGVEVTNGVTGVTRYPLALIGRYSVTVAPAGGS